MNLYIIIITLIILLLIALFLSKNVFSPVSILIISYLFSAFLIIPNIDSWNVDLHNITRNIILIGIISFFLGYFCYFMFNRDDKKTVTENKYYKIPKFSKYFFITLETSALILNFYFISKIVGGINLSNFSAQMEKYRELSAYSTQNVSVPFFASQLKKFSNLGYYFVAYIFFENYLYNRNSNTKRSNNTLFFAYSFLIQFSLSMLSAGRYNIICLILGTITLFTILKSKNKKNISQTFKVSDYIKLVFIMIIILLLFSGMRTVVGRTNQSNFFDYISSYFGGSIPLYDKYLLKYPFTKSEYFGYYTLRTLYSALSKLGIVSNVRATNFEFMISGTLHGNVYTSFVVMYRDFGMIGVIIFQLLEGYICAIMFQKVYLKNKGTKNSIILTILYCSHISSIYLHSYGENFFSLILSQSIVLELIYIYIIYFIFYKLKVVYKR